MRLLLTILAGLLVASSSHVGVAQTMSFDVTDGLFANIPSGATGGSATQVGNQHWYYKYEPAVRFGQMGVVYHTRSHDFPIDGTWP